MANGCKQILISDSDSILKSFPIQIIHKHPDFSHKVRSDLDPHEFVAISYPMALANKIIPFLESPNTQRPPSPLKRKKSTSPCKVSPSKRFCRNKNISPPRRRLSPTKSSHDEGDTKLPVPKSTPTLLPTPSLTPERQLLPAPNLHPTTIDTSYTSRTITPGGNAFSPLKVNHDSFSLDLPTPYKLQLLPQDPTIIPIALFTPVPPRVRPEAQKFRNRRLNRDLPIPSPIEFDTTPRSIDGYPPKMTLTLRHDVSTQALRDVFEWCRRSVEMGRIEELTKWLVKFRDASRVREIREVCVVLGLSRMRDIAEETLDRFEEF